MLLPGSERALGLFREMDLLVGFFRIIGVHCGIGAKIEIGFIPAEYPGTTGIFAAQSSVQKNTAT